MSDREFEAPDLIEVMDAAVRYNRFILEQIVEAVAGARHIIDFGAGNGRFAIGLHKRGFDVAAVEPDAGLRNQIGQEGVPTYAEIDAIPPGNAGAIYSINVLEHIDDDISMLREFHDRLAPDGRLFLYVPAFQLLFSANDERVGHVRRYRRTQLVDVVKAAGFDVDSARYVDSIGFFAGLAYRVFGNKDGGLNSSAVKLYDGAVFPLSRLVDQLAGRWFGKNLMLRARKC